MTSYFKVTPLPKEEEEEYRNQETNQAAVAAVAAEEEAEEEWHRLARQGLFAKTSKIERNRKRNKLHILYPNPLIFIETKPKRYTQTFTLFVHFYIMTH